MSPEIQRADERLRIRWLLLLTLAAALGAAGILRLDGYFDELHTLMAESPPAAAEKIQPVVRALLALMGAVGRSGYLPP